MTAHDQLLQHLRESVAERREAPAPRRRRVFRGGGRALALAAALVVAAGAIAAAAQVGVLPGTGHHASNTISYRQAAYAAMKEAQRTPACRPLRERTVTAEIPALAAPLFAGRTDPVAERLAVRDAHSGPYVTGSARRFALPGGVAIALWATVGQGLSAYSDPAACGAERVAQLHRDYPDPGSRLRQKAEAFLRTSTDVVPGAETLWVMTRFPGRSAMTGGAFPMTEATLTGGGALFGGSYGYTGFARPGTVRVTAAGGHGYHGTARPVRGFYVLRPPRGTGPIVIREHAADGRVTARRTVRG